MHPSPGSGDVARSEAPTVSGPVAVRICLLGGFRVSVGDKKIEGSAWRLRKAAALVKLLALVPGHRLHRERVQDLLWPDLGKHAASNNLRQCLYATRRTLGTESADASRYIRSRDEQILLCPEERLWVDVEAFEEAGAAARRARDPAAYRAALDLYAGDLLPDDLYEGWAEERRTELRRSCLDLLAELAGLYEERGELEAAAEALRRAVVHDPTSEEAHVGLMRLYALSGRQGSAIAQYEQLRDVLSERLGTEPGAAARKLRDEIAAGNLSPARTGPSPESPAAADKHNLPAPRTSFVGRERDLVEVKRALAMTRLLTLTGAGGAGKTRLAQEVARDLVGAYPDGVWLVELAALSEPDLVPKAMAGALGVPERPDEPLTETLLEALRSRTALLVVDNCEHLVRAAASLVDALLGACPRLRVLATSREPLDVAGEMNWPVSPLGVPAPRRKPTAAELEGSESVRLFVERARLRNPAFALTPDNAGAVAEV
jgi:DNA-binding SARP family transcriptional activator